MGWMDVAPRPFALLAALLLIGGGILALEQPWKPGSAPPPPPPGIPESALQHRAAPSFLGATGWLGTADGGPLHLEALRGQVVLVDFWTYSCINCIRTFPHVQGWHERYAADGLVVVGVHTPEFRFEHERANVQAARERHGLTYPTAQDNDYSIWNGYANRFWPAKYLIDQWGRIRYQHFGEGRYAETEQHIRDLLAEAGRSPAAAPQEPGVEPAAAVRGLTPELFAGDPYRSGRNALGNPEGYRPGQTMAYARPAEVPRDRIFLVGTWENQREQVVAAEDGAGVLVRFRAGGANFVAAGAEGACVPVRLDGLPFEATLAARDVAFPADGAPCIRLDGPRSYDFYAGPFQEHLVELTVPRGFALFTFAFSPDPR